MRMIIQEKNDLSLIELHKSIFLDAKKINTIFDLAFLGDN